MYRNRNSTSQHDLNEHLQNLPIPQAALVIDMRKIRDDALKMLEVEIENLADEMDMKNVDHWRYLTSFIEFKSISPLSDDDIKALRREEDKQQPPPRSTTGRYNLGTRQHGPDKYYQEEDIEPSFVEHIPNDELKRNIEECMNLIDTIRNNRFKAIGDLGKTGRIGPHTANSKVQIIFLADEEEPNSLSSSAAYAAYLKQAYESLEQTVHSIDTMIICLNHNNPVAAPKLLINRLAWVKRKPEDEDWWHIDALFLCERFGHNGVRIPQTIQPYLAELLLYVQLIAPPRMIRPAFPDTSNLYTTSRQLALPSPSAPDKKTRVKDTLTLPTRTYVIGLNAIEYSGRWGRRYLNYGLVSEAIQILQDKQYEQPLEARQTADSWLRRWRIQARQVIPDQVNGNIPALQAFPHGEKIAQDTNKIFESSPLRLDTGKKGVKAFEAYSNEVAQTYILSTEEQEDIWTKSSASALATNDLEQLTLQSALSSAPTILQRVHSWKLDDPETPLVEIWLSALRVLSHPDFFPGPQGIKGAIPRARTQLGELSRVISDFQNSYKRSLTPLAERRKRLIEMKEERVADLEHHNQRFPLLAGLLHLKDIVAWVTVLLVTLLSALGIIVLFAWLHHLLHAIPNATGFNDLLAILDGSSLAGLSFYSIIIWIVLLIMAAIGFAVARRIVRNPQISAVRVEGYFFVALFAFPALGFIIGFSSAMAANDPLSYSFLSWVSQLPLWSNALLLITLTLFFIEVLYYLYWNSKRKNALKKMVADIQRHRTETATMVKSYLADTVALELLHRAELTDSNGNAGSYYHRIDHIHQLLDDIRRSTTKQQALSRERLTPLSSGKLASTSTTGKTPTLDIRTEILDVPKLTTNSRRLSANMAEKESELQELTEILLRMMGEEDPMIIERHIREHPDRLQQFTQVAFQQNQEKHNAQLLLSLSTALTLRQEIEPFRGDPTAPLLKRYRELDYHVADDFSGLKQLLGRIQNDIGKEKTTTAANGATSANSSTSATEDITESYLTDYALTTWCQSLWEHKDPELDRLLEARSITEYLQREGYDPQTIRSMLATRTVITGRSKDVNQLGELFILRFPSLQSNRFFADMGLETHFVDIPDMERLILLYVHQYVALPHIIIEEVPANGVDDTDETIM